MVIIGRPPFVSDRFNKMNAFAAPAAHRIFPEDFLAYGAMVETVRIAGTAEQVIFHGRFPRGKGLSR
jgi:hypothetical protein